MIKIPNSISIANLPTRIENLKGLSEELQKNIFIKRDDFTGCEVSGNKVRKLEYSVKDAIDKGCNTLITCGGIQSNHARATAAVAARLGLKSILVLRSNETPKIDGNYLLDEILGSEVRIITSDQYRDSREEIMESIKKEVDSQGDKAYIIPEGASNGIGTFGYFNCFKEILEQEKLMNKSFDTILVPVGSGGTYAGLFLANKLLNSKKRIIGINVCDDAEFFKNKISEIVQETLDILGKKLDFSKDEIEIIDGYVGRGYSLSRKEEIDFIKKIGRTEGVILDPVYTGKALYGLYNESKNKNLDTCKNILFIHTGGIFGLFKDYEEDIQWKIWKNQTIFGMPINFH